MQYRPISDILKTNTLLAKGKGSVLRDRRGGNRFACKFSAVLSINGKEYPVECLEISKGGIRIQVHPPPHLKLGQLVFVRLRIGTYNFGDTFDVIRTTRTAQGTTNVHLHTQVVEPAEAAKV